MTATTFSTRTSATSVSQQTQTSDRPVLWRAALGYGAGAAAATTLIAAAAGAMGVAPAIEGEQIPLLGFTQLTFVCALLGLAVAAGLRRWSTRPQRRFVATTVALTALSCVPDLLIDTTVASRIVLITTHLVAASIVVPALARRLPQSRSNRGD